MSQITRGKTYLHRRGRSLPFPFLGYSGTALLPTQGFTLYSMAYLFIIIALFPRRTRLCPCAFVLFHKDTRFAALVILGKL